MAKRGIPPDYAKRIIKLREQAGLTQTHLADRIGVTPAAVSQWESGASRPSARHRQQIVRAETLGLHALSDGYACPSRSGQPVTEARVAYEVSSDAAAGLTFATDPEIVRLAMGCQRLVCGHLVNPTFSSFPRFGVGIQSRTRCVVRAKRESKRRGASAEAFRRRPSE